VDIVTSSRDDPRRQSLLKMIACILNKDQNDAQITTFVNSVVSDMWTSKEDHDRRKESLELVSWVTPAEILLNVSWRKHWFYELMHMGTNLFTFSLTCCRMRNGVSMRLEHFKLLPVMMIYSIRRIMLLYDFSINNDFSCMFFRNSWKVYHLRTIQV
jgi:hypothetical protein